MHQRWATLGVVGATAALLLTAAPNAAATDPGATGPTRAATTTTSAAAPVDAWRCYDYRAKVKVAKRARPTVKAQRVGWVKKGGKVCVAHVAKGGRYKLKGCGGRDNIWARLNGTRHWVPAKCLRRA
ncbi:hypothetical protein ACMA1D_29145 [Streptomyces sp. 796.1]|uniref:hypothetical protein n=1 Tax=Streptomyces sp. 796.1 TaxID=3163029 RepID=UPI0039C8CD6B